MRLNPDCSGSSGSKGLCPTNVYKSDKGDKMVPMPYLWTKTPKVHKSVYSSITRRMNTKWTFEEIYLEVVKSGIEDEDDQIQTTRAIVIFRDYCREMDKRYAVA